MGTHVCGGLMAFINLLAFNRLIGRKVFFTQSHTHTLRGEQRDKFLGIWQF
jgi:hypothetical protein